MRWKWMFAPVLFFAFAASLNAQYPPPFGGQDRWDSVPRDFNEVQRNGFRDGMIAAQRDLEGQRRPSVFEHDEYRRPGLANEFWEQYRIGFKRGYELGIAKLAVEKLFPGALHGDWDTAPNQYGDYQRRGFEDGQVGAQRDVDNHRRSDPNNRDEYRDPRVPQQFVEEYREGFRRGYELAMGRIMGEYDNQNASPQRYDEYQRRGFADGQVGAQRDADNHRRPDPNNRDEYRSPHVPPQFADAYREGFRRGYEVAVGRMMGGRR